MDYKIGQVFEINGIWYQFVEDNNKGCENCVFYQGKSECANPDENVKCVKWIREDGRDGHFVRLLPIGDVYEQGGAIWQQYKCVDMPNTEDKRVYISRTNSDAGLIISVRLTENDDLNLIERKIGEIFEHNGEWYQCVECDSCGNCSLRATECGNGTKSDLADEVFGQCSKVRRSDNKHAIFKKLEKVGEPFKVGRELCQHYKVFDIDNVCGDVSWNVHNYKAKTILIELKQNKEDMEEVNNPNLSNSENIGKNLKAFDLQAAKSGKPVCTRDGRKARIICFDRNDLYPIVALIECEDGKEIIGAYSKEGQTDIYEIKGTNLMMLPEKKEGWVNVYTNRIDGPYTSREYAIRQKMGDCIDTVKIQWEE